MLEKLSSFSDKVVKKVKTQMKEEHLENTTKLKAYFKPGPTGMPRSLIPKDIGATGGAEAQADLNLIKSAISLLPADVLPNCMLAYDVRDTESSLI
jgi:hypothetical protein